MLSKTMEKALNDQIQKEYYSSYLYLAMSAYCEANNLPGSAVWMRIQSKEELSHAMKLYDAPQVSRKEIETMLGEGLTRIMKKFDELKDLGIDVTDVRKHFRDYYLSNIAVYSRPYPGVEDTLERLKPFKKAVV